MASMCPPSPLLALKSASRKPTGTMHTSEMRPTSPIGLSRSTRGSMCWPPLAARAREAASAELRPAMTGLTSLASVHTAATAMVPAPTKRTWWLQTDCASCVIESWLASRAE